METDKERYAGLEPFQGVDLDAVEGLLEQCRETVAEAGTVLLEAGSPNRSLYVILEGSLHVHLRSLDNPPLLELGPGACAGELSILGQDAASAHVVAAERSRLLVIPEEVVWRLINASHPFATNLLYILSGRVREGNDRYYRCWQASRQFARYAMLDSLTGLPNRRWLDEVLERQFQRCRQDGLPLSVIMLDVDNFKEFNDSHGHLAGDRALAFLAASLRRHLRPTDLAARFGGEEFLVMMPEVTLGEALLVAERLRRDIESRTVEIDDEGARATMTISLGVAQALEAPSARALVEEADNRLYEAKKAGRNRVRPELDTIPPVA